MNRFSSARHCILHIATAHCLKVTACVNAFVYPDACYDSIDVERQLWLPNVSVTGTDGSKHALLPSRQVLLCS